jgi:transposase
MTDTVLGIDVSKKTLDTSIRIGGKLRCRSFVNAPDGWRQLIRWLTEHKIPRLHACLEATGRYSLGVALALHQAGHVVSIVNPAQIRDFARIKLGRNKVSMLRISANTPNCSSRCPGPRPRRRCGGWRATNDPVPASSPAL